MANEYLKTTLGIKSDGKPLEINFEERLGGIYILGVTRVGKTRLIREMFIQDIENGIGSIYIDPVAENFDDLKKRLNPDELKRIKIIDLTNEELLQITNNIDFNEILEKNNCFIIKFGYKLKSTERTLVLDKLIRELSNAILNRPTLSIKNKPFSIYLDELQNYTSYDYYQEGDLSDLIYKSGNFNVALTIAHQYLDQLITTMYVEKIENVVCFRTASSDSSMMSYVLNKVSIKEIENLKMGEFYFKHGDGRISKANLIQF